MTPKAHTDVPFGYATSVHGCVEESRDWVASFVIIGCREWRRISNETEDSNEPPERAGREGEREQEHGGRGEGRMVLNGVRACS